MKKFLNSERIVSLVIILFALYIWFAANNFPKSFIDQIGPGTYPKLLAILMGIPAVLMFITAKGSEEEVKGERQYLKTLYLIGVLVIYMLIFNKIGYIIDTILLLLAIVMFYDERDVKTRLKYGIPFAVMFTAGTYLFFAKLMGVLLPTLIL